MYADQATDLLAIDISNPENVQIASRVKNVFPFGSQYPQQLGVYFECPDPDKGLVIGWEYATLDSPNAIANLITKDYILLNTVQVVTFKNKIIKT